MYGERVSFSIQDISLDIKTENITKTTKGETSVLEQHFKPNIRIRTSRNPLLIWEERGAFTCMNWPFPSYGLARETFHIRVVFS